MKGTAGSPKLAHWIGRLQVRQTTGALFLAIYIIFEAQYEVKAPYEDPLSVAQILFWAFLGVLLETRLSCFMFR